MNTCFLKLHLILLTILLLTVSGRAMSDDWVYSVKEGDTLWSLVADYLINASYLEKVQRLNNIPDPLDLPVGSKITIPTEWLKVSSEPVYANAIQGIIRLFKKTGGSSRLKQGDRLGIGDSVRTQKNASVSLKFKNDTHVVIAENSDLTIEALEQPRNNNQSKVTLHLKKGRVETYVDSSKNDKAEFIIRTPVSVTSVRGTQYRISAMPADDVSHTEVLEGQVDVSNAGGNQQIPKDHGTIVLKGMPPQPAIKLLDPPTITGVSKVFGQFPATFVLADLDNQQQYRVQIAKTDAFQTILFNQLFSSAEIQLPELPDAIYYLRIRRIDHYGLEGKNAQFSVVFNTKLQTPELLKPQSEAEFFDNTMTFSWEKGKVGQEYRFQLSSTEDFSQLVINKNNIAASDFKWNDALDEGKYFWRVTAVDKGKQSPFSKARVIYKKLPIPHIVSVKIIKGELSVDFDHAPAKGLNYQFQIAKHKNFSSLMLDKTFSASTLKSPALTAGKYYVRARVVKQEAQTGIFTTPQSIDIPKKKNRWFWTIPFLVMLVFITIKYR